MIKTSPNPTTKPNHQILTVFYIYLGPITRLRADFFLISPCDNTQDKFQVHFCDFHYALLDMSAAFDVVDHGILLSKLKLYGFDSEAVSWMKDYLYGRSQAVYIDGALSSFLQVNVGVPQ